FLSLFLLSAGSCLAQEMPPDPLPLLANTLHDQGSVDQTQAPSTITVPEGTRLQLALANPIHAGSAHAGDIVRAVTTFPVTVGQQVAIPQGAFLEGAVVKVGKRGSTRFDGLQIQFQQLVFSNGYNVTLEGTVLQAKAIDPGAVSNDAPGTPGLIANGLRQGGTAALMASSLQQGPTPTPTPTPPPLPQVGPPKGPIIAASLAGMAALIVMGIISHNRHGHEARDFDTGFQFEMVLQAPLTLDSARVAAALAATNGK
ncbi:MAG TPA: hypothetical protein VFI60_02815, partial [Candidatus Acidoferrum sp.]|nr:hypothetical protein [Candidatus Acidoferrum sp.]